MAWPDPFWLISKYRALLTALDLHEHSFKFQNMDDKETKQADGSLFDLQSDLELDQLRA